MPTAKIVWYLSDPVGMSPPAVAPMNVVMVSTDPRGSSVRLGSSPAATSTIMVSPIAREHPSTIAATMPDSAAGNTTRTATCKREAPSPKAPSRRPAGTADIASSETEATVGRTMKPITIPADRALKTPTSKPSRSRSTTGVKNVRAK